MWVKTKVVKWEHFSEQLSESMSVEKKVFLTGNEWVVKLVVLLESSSAFQKAKQKEKNSVVLSDGKSESTKGK
jgi:hypothetical protein